MGQGFGRIVTIVLLIGLLASFLALIFGDSTRSRADRLANFTRRQGVKVTATSAPYVSNALARSRFGGGPVWSSPSSAARASVCRSVPPTTRTPLGPNGWCSSVAGSSA